MKMNKSIKDYKNAMDNIKISDSFYKRTEKLLNELLEIEIEKIHVFTVRRIPTVISAIAACFLLVFGLQFVISKNHIIENNGHDEIINEDSSSNADAGSPIIEFIAGKSEDVAFEEDDEIFEEEICSDEGETDSLEAIYEAAVTTEKEGYPKLPEIRGSENIPNLGDINSELVTVEITPYFDVGSIKSGENPITKSGKEYKELINDLAEITESSSKINNHSFSSIFLIRIINTNSELPFYSIYVTDNSTLVITKHDLDSQKRCTYALTPENFDCINHLLFLQFGNESDYELFLNVIAKRS